MTKKEKLENVCSDFSKLSEEQQDYILGITQALVFAKNSGDQPESENLPAAERGISENLTSNTEGSCF